MSENTFDPTSTSLFGPSLNPVEATDTPLTTYPLNEENAAAVAALPPATALLIVRRGPNAGARFLLDTASTSVGRHTSSDIFLDDVTVSRRHAEFVQTSEGGYLVRDAGSLNGTYVNRERVEQIDLREGDEVQIGKFRMSYHPSRQG
ncbi:FHA domain-containing protein [Boudabousia tangfeifanii]|uniref:FHA domain-containing protein n=1 Tax=Boudabousia tangfeifanii TaxID=1912795 RepID=A0A1D9MKC9_9ACTO|nr:FHA domain-containing protein [Boudabousia tangfeifanii]AOZ72639.1 FHA domain-containing protein [Boudabousia tangfeifanii]